MGSTDVFELHSEILRWQEATLKDKGITESDQVEITDHLRDTVTKLQKMGLSSEEAFVVAKMRLGHAEDWGEELKEVSDDNFQIKKVVNVFLGMLIYFTAHFAIIAFIFTAFIVFDKLAIGTVDENLHIQSMLWKGAYIITFLVILSCFIYRRKLIPWLKRITISATSVTISFVFFMAALLGERFARYHIAGEVLPNYENYRSLGGFIYMPAARFQYFFPMLVCFSFLIIFFLYRKKNYV